MTFESSIWMGATLIVAGLPVVFGLIRFTRLSSRQKGGILLSVLCISICIPAFTMEQAGHFSFFWGYLRLVTEFALLILIFRAEFFRVIPGFDPWKWIGSGFFALLLLMFLFPEKLGFLFIGRILESSIFVGLALFYFISLYIQGHLWYPTRHFLFWIASGMLLSGFCGLLFMGLILGRVVPFDSAGPNLLQIGVGLRSWKGTHWGMISQIVFAFPLSLACIIGLLQKDRRRIPGRAPWKVRV